MQLGTHAATSLRLETDLPEEAQPVVESRQFKLVGKLTSIGCRQHRQLLALRHVDVREELVLGVRADENFALLRKVVQREFESLL